MAISITQDGPTAFAGTVKVARGTVTLDSSYPAGGEAITLSDLDMDRIDALFIDSPDAYDLVWDGSNSAPKIKAYTPVSAYTDSTGGTAATTLAAGVGKYLVTIPVNLATVADGDVVTALPIPHKFKITAVDAYVTQEVTTASKATTLNVEIGTTNLTGGAVALTSANCATLGAKIAGSAVTAANTGAADATISVEAASTTAFAEGEVMLVISMQNMDTADAFASLLVASDEVAATTDLSTVVGRFTAIGA